MPLVHLSGAARQDLIDHFAYLDEEAGQELADRFLQAAETCLNLLATQPGMGSPLRLRSALSHHLAVVRNTDTCSTSCCAWRRRLSAAAALCSTRAAFCCVPRSSSVTTPPI